MLGVYTVAEELVFWGTARLNPSLRRQWAGGINQIGQNRSA